MSLHVFTCLHFCLLGMNAHLAGFRILGSGSCSLWISNPLGATLIIIALEQIAANSAALTTHTLSSPQCLCQEAGHGRQGPCWALTGLESRCRRGCPPFGGLFRSPPATAAVGLRSPCWPSMASRSALEAPGGLAMRPSPPGSYFLKVGKSISLPRGRMES